MKHITVDQLRKAGACSEQVNLFEDLLGTKPVEVTFELALEHREDFDWDWAASNLLDWPAEQVYNAAVQPAEQVYRAAVQPAGQVYLAAVQSARQVYRAAVQPAEQVYRAAVQPAEQVYRAAKIVAFVNAYLAMDEPTA